MTLEAPERDRNHRGAIGFAERVLELLDEGRYTATYKYAVLLALIDLCLECTEDSGVAPTMLTTPQVAQKVIEIYWPHAVPFATGRTSSILKQNVRSQAEIVGAIVDFRARHVGDATAPFWQARQIAPDAYARLVRSVEWKLIEMPLPRLQMMGRASVEFIYRVHWDHRITRRAVAPYLAGKDSSFDNRILLKQGVGEYFVQLNGLLRPLIHRRWAAMVAQVNHLQDSQLEEFLFGATRMATARVRGGLWEIQERRCFYCDGTVRDVVQAHVDHFIPWTRYPDDGLDNLVVTDGRCNGDKGSSLAAAEHLARWSRRVVEGTPQFAQLRTLGETTQWWRGADRTLGAARGIYLRLSGDARLWRLGNAFVGPDFEAITAALAQVGTTT